MDTLGRQAPGNRQPDANTSPGDGSHLVFQAKVHVVSFFPVECTGATPLGRSRLSGRDVSTTLIPAASPYPYLIRGYRCPIYYCDHSVVLTVGLLKMKRSAISGRVIPCGTSGLSASARSTLAARFSGTK
jgi:hypothetical protein